MSEDIIKYLNSIEEKAAQIILDAKQRCIEIEAHSKNTSKELIEKAIQEAKKGADNIILNSDASLKKKSINANEQFKYESTKIAQSATKYMEKAKKLVIERILNKK